MSTYTPTSYTPERRNSDTSGEDSDSWQRARGDIPAVHVRYHSVGFAGDEEKALLGLDSKPKRMDLSRTPSFAHQVVRKRNRYVSLLMLIAIVTSGTLLANTSHGDTARRVLLAPIDRFKGKPARVEVCDPFNLPGTLVTEKDADGNLTTFWKAFDEQVCPSSRLSLDVKHALASHMPEHELHAKFSFMRNRTVVKIGDEIDRDHVVDFCKQVGGELTVLNVGDESAVPDLTNGRDELAFTHDEHRTSELGRPHVCRIDALNFEMINFFVYGLASFREFQDEGYIFTVPQGHSPAEFGERVKHTVLETLSLRDRGSDIVEFNSNLWDVRHLIEQDRRMVHETQAIEPASLSQLAWYRVRLSMALGHLQYTFPQSQILWRRPHAISYEQRKATYTRSVQLGQVADALLADRPDIRIDNFGSLLNGQAPFFADAVQPGPRFSSVWSDLILFELQRIVS